MAPLDSRYTQVGLILISVQVCPTWLFILRVTDFNVGIISDTFSALKESMTLRGKIISQVQLPPYYTQTKTISFFYDLPVISI